MSEPTIWDIAMGGNPPEKFVPYADYARLKAEVARLYTEVMNLEEDSMSKEYYAGENDKENTRLKAEVERLKATMEKVILTADKIDEQNQRLRKAGDYMAINIPRMVTCRVEANEATHLMEVWNAAKEGKPSV